MYQVFPSNLGVIIMKREKKEEKKGGGDEFKVIKDSCFYSPFIETNFKQLNENLLLHHSFVEFVIPLLLKIFSP